MNSAGQIDAERPTLGLSGSGDAPATVRDYTRQALAEIGELHGIPVEQIRSTCQFGHVVVARDHVAYNLRFDFSGEQLSYLRIARAIGVGENSAIFAVRRHAARLARAARLMSASDFDKAFRGKIDLRTLGISPDGLRLLTDGARFVPDDGLYDLPDSMDLSPEDAARFGL